MACILKHSLYIIFRHYIPHSAHRIYDKQSRASYIMYHIKYKHIFFLFLSIYTISLPNCLFYVSFIWLTSLYLARIYKKVSGLIYCPDTRYVFFISLENYSPFSILAFNAASVSLSPRELAAA